MNESEKSRNKPWMDRKQKDDVMFSQGHKTECCAAVPRSARQQNRVRRHDGSNHQETQRGKLQTKRIQISQEFPSASNHFTHCWADTQHFTETKNSLVDNTVNSFTFNLYTRL